jgi:hypothetical protein
MSPAFDVSSGKETTITMEDLAKRLDRLAELLHSCLVSIGTIEGLGKPPPPPQTDFLAWGGGLTGVLARSAAVVAAVLPATTRWEWWQPWR